MSSQPSRTHVSLWSSRGLRDTGPLLAKGAEYDKGIDDDVTPLFLASEKGNLDIVTRLVTSGAGEVNKAEKNGDTPLHAALRRGRPDTGEYLLNAGADCDKMNDDGVTPLYLASRRGYLEIVERLVKSGANLNRENQNGDTVLHVALRMGRPDTGEYLMTAGADCDKMNGDGVTPLYLASRRGYLDIVERLVKSGANVNRANKTGDTALHVALRKGHFDTVKYLISKGAEYDKENEDGESPLYLAAKQGYLEIVENLVKSGANVNKAKKNGDTPLHAASCRGHFDTKKYLMSKGAEYDMENEDGESPLHLASRRAFLDMIMECWEDFYSPRISGMSKGQKGFGQLPTHSAFDAGPSLKSRITDVPTQEPSISDCQKNERADSPFTVTLSSDESIGNRNDEQNCQFSSNDEQTITERKYATVRREDKCIAEHIVTSEGGELSISSHGFYLSVPPGALDSSEKISVQPLFNLPKVIAFKRDEIVASLGFKCQPPGIIFKKPVKLTIPHCALISDPERVECNLYYGGKDGGNKIVFKNH